MDLALVSITCGSSCQHTGQIAGWGHRRDQPQAQAANNQSPFHSLSSPNGTAATLHVIENPGPTYIASCVVCDKQKIRLTVARHEQNQRARDELRSGAQATTHKKQQAKIAEWVYYLQVSHLPPVTPVRQLSQRVLSIRIPRRRHFKCDETKPACLACLKYQGFCTGYTPAKTQPLAKPPPQRLVYPKLAVSQAKAKLALEPSYASLTFSNQLEKDHFDYWLAFSQASCLFRSDFVAQIIPQLSWDDSVIKHLAIAIGAAALGGNTREQRICGKGKFHKDALVHYGKALNMLCSSPMSSERTLLACLMFITFESLQGNRAAGLNHINQGFRILEQCHQSLEAERSALLDGISSSFQKFSHQAWALNGLHPQETEKRVPWCCRGRKARYAIEEMPPVFETLEVARRWWAIVRHHIEHHAPLRTKFQVKGSSMTDHPMLSPEDGAPGTLAYIHSFTRYLDQWDAAFRPLAIKVHNNEENYHLRALSLRIQYLYLWAGVRTGSWTDETEAEKITATFRDIVALSRQLLAAEASRPPPRAGEGDVEVFSMDDSPTWPLACAYRVCKAPDVQNEVVQLFKQYPRRDGLLDTQAFLVVMEWVERNASAGIIMNMPSPVVDCVVWDDSTVTLQRQLWDPATSEWSDKSIKFSIV